MKKVIIFGNSGSGKSTLSKHYAAKFNLQHLDLDILAWEDSNPPTRKDLASSTDKINQFINQNSDWVIEGGYADLLTTAMVAATEIIFLNLNASDCIKNCKNRPWEPHKYSSIEKQNENLEMLLNWVKQYYDRTDEFSLISHTTLFNEFNKTKTEYKTNSRI